MELSDYTPLAVVAGLVVLLYYLSTALFAFAARTLMDGDSTGPEVAPQAPVTKKKEQ